MDTKYDFGTETERPIVYVRQVNADELPEELRQQLGGLTTLYAVHNAEGERLALVRDRSLAYVLARQHDLVPVAVH
ncbi:DUF1150 family protein [Roseovarius amoyensis]|uniref:DUF1150 family protein n=1 Tax=Roseovarius amoyensis TaxID=2211448 RepID=UPI000DBE4865|nr:DUF1150 family protein [Roseovarius amoyensis]